MKVLILLLACFVISTNSYSEWHQGFSTTNLYCYKEKDKTLYLGYNNGLRTFDKKTNAMFYFNSLNSKLPGNFINDFLSLIDGTTLISTNQGLALIGNGTITTDNPICHDYPEIESRKLFLDSSGNIWTFSSQKVNTYNKTKGKWYSFNIRNLTNYPIEILNMVVQNNRIWVLFNDNSKFKIDYYYQTYYNENLRAVVLSDTSVVRIFQTSAEFPLRQGSVSVTATDDILYWSNFDGVYSYNDTSWIKTDIFNIPSFGKVHFLSKFQKDPYGNIWYYVKKESSNSYRPASYNIQSGKTTLHLENELDQGIREISILPDGSVIAYSTDFFYFKNNTGWTKRSINDFGLDQGTLFNFPMLYNNQLYVAITKTYPEIKSGDIYCLNDSSIIHRIYEGCGYTALKKACINASGKGVYQGRYEGEQMLYEADSGLVRPELISDFSITKPNIDGNVYFNNLRYDNSLKSPYLTTWQNNNLININMGFLEYPDYRILDFEMYNEYIIALGQYYTGKDSLTSTISVYNTKTKNLQTYDKNNSSLPDYYFERNGIFLKSMDSAVISLSVKNENDIWILTDSSLIEFTKEKANIYPRPDSYIYFSNDYDCLSNQILFKGLNNKFLYFDIDYRSWDSLDFKDCGFYGNFINYQMLLDNRIWACDDLGYLYKYIGNGMFEVFDLKISGKANLGFPINDFCIDPTFKFHLATDIGLLTNDNLLDVENANNIKYQEFFISPNPATDFIYLNMGLQPLVPGEQIKIYNSLGECVMSLETGLRPVSTKIDISALSAGVYFVRCGSEIGRFVKL